MKKFTLLILFITLFKTIGYSQNTFVPDDNFEQALIDLGYDTGTLNNLVPTSNISGVTILNVDDKGISDLTGIEDFTALTELRCYTNSITNLDLSANTQLIYLHCSANSLTSLDVSANTQLQFLNCSINAIGSLNLNQNSLLSNFDASNNQLTGLSIVNGAGNIITNFNSINNPNLTCIQVDNANYSTNNWTDIDAHSSFSTDCHYNDTYVPDDNFEQALIDLGYDSGSLDDYVPTANIDTLTSLDVSNKSISDLTGIEDFVALSVLRCQNNNLTSLDISNNTSLTELTCSDNSLTNLDVTNNTALIYLFCYGNNLTSLDVGSNTSLLYLYCHTNNLTSLDVSGITSMIELNCYTNNLSSLNLVNNTSLQILRCYDNELTGINLKNGNNTSIVVFDATSNPNLTCIQVEDAVYSSNNWTFIDAQTSFSEDCHYNDTYVPDDNFEQALIDLGYDFGPLDDFVFTANINTLTSLDVSSKSITDLTGIEDFVDLTNLLCDDNNLTSLDISNNTALTTLDSSSNSLTSLDVSNNTALTYLNCGANGLTSLDVTNNIGLTELYCSVNNLSSLDVSNNIALTILYCHIDNDLTNLDVSNNTLLTELACGYNNLSSLDVSNNTALTTLSCQGNNFTNLNLESNSLLENLFCINSNNLTSINLKNGNNTIITNFNTTNNPNLICIEVENAAYSTTNWTDIDAQSGFSTNCSDTTYIPDDNFEQALIDLGYDFGPLDDFVFTANINTLTSLFIPNKNISDLTGIEDFTAVNFLTCSNNNLTNLNISNNLLLLDLFCGGNNLTSIDVSSNTILTSLFCANNNLTSLNVKNGSNTNIINFDATGNPNLTCIEVDDETYSTTNWTNIDAASSFSEDCAAVLNTNDETLLEKAITIYPNPASDFIYLESTIALNKIVLYDLLGKELLSTQETSQIKVENIPSGMYLLKIFSENGFAVKQVIIK